MEVIGKDEDIDMDTGGGDKVIVNLIPVVRNRVVTSDLTSFDEFPTKLFRPLACQTGLLTNPHGSVKLFQGDTCVVAAVFGPTEVRLAKELAQRGAVDVIYRPKVTSMSQIATPIMDPILAERNMEHILNSIFETSIHLEEVSGLGYNIIVHEYEDDGNLLSTCVNAITIALLDGGCALRHTVAAVTLIVTNDKKLIIDPCSNQLKQGYETKITYAFSNAMEVLYTNSVGHAAPSVLKIAQVKAREAAGEMFKFYHFLALKKNSRPVTFDSEVKVKGHVLQDAGRVKVEQSSSASEEGELSNSESDN